jgi:hypothetical protein
MVFLVSYSTVLVGEGSEVFIELYAGSYFVLIPRIRAG